MHSALYRHFIHLAAITLAVATALAGVGMTSARASSQIVAQISISQQTMDVLVDGRPTFRWKVSTAGKGYVTPTGSFKPTRMHKMWHSRKYDNAPMPHSVFFHGGYAVHATDHVRRLGTPASHGCIRLAPNNASDFYTLVEAFGRTNTQIVIVK
ncbi:L,D-transpeptidase [Corticibacterium sp. UT-5YL-CI-8]|nr:L,D-transpeptidase [Tianweitania sp. UT-5YL-CI-8]